MLKISSETMRQVCFINPPYTTFMEDLDAPFNLMYLAAVAEQCGWQAQIVDMKTPEDVIPEADVYGVTSSSPQWDEAISLSERLTEEHPKALKVVGGTHISAMPDELIGTCFDVAVIGEGERALQRILNNDVFNMDVRFIEGEPIGDLDTIPFPARHLVDWSRYKRGIYWGKEKLADAVSIISSRGCPFNCIFCGSHVVFGHRTRFRTIGNVVAEVKHVIDTMGYRGFNFHDDTFCLNIPRVVGMSRAFAKLGIVWRCLTRVDTMDMAMLDEMAKSGCKEAILGVESGSDKILKNLNKGTTAKQNLRAMRMVKDAGIQLKIGIIVGSPGETWETVKETENLLRKCPPDLWNVSVLTPFPGSAIWNNPAKYGLKILTKDLKEYAMVGKDHKGNVVVETERMTKKDIEQARDLLIDLLTDISPPPL